jgi:hypothetical protein
VRRDDDVDTNRDGTWRRRRHRSNDSETRERRARRRDGNNVID